MRCNKKKSGLSEKIINNAQESESEKKASLVCAILTRRHGEKDEVRKTFIDRERMVW